MCQSGASVQRPAAADSAPMDPPPLPCPLHGPAAACDRCPAGFPTDGQGFPHASATGLLQRLRHCPGCGRLVSPEQWDARPTGRGPHPRLGPWLCLDCSNATGAAPAGTSAKRSSAP